MAEGQQYVSTSDTRPSATPEKIVRPFESFKERRDQRLAELRAPPGTVQEAELCWGRAPQNQASPTNPTDTGGFNTRSPTDEPKDPGEPPTFEFREQKRKVKKIKVESNDDPEIFVMVERIEEWTAKGPSAEPFRGGVCKFIFKNK